MNNETLELFVSVTLIIPELSSRRLNVNMSVRQLREKEAVTLCQQQYPGCAVSATADVEQDWEQHGADAKVLVESEELPVEQCTALSRSLVDKLEAVYFKGDWTVDSDQYF